MSSDRLIVSSFILPVIREDVRRWPRRVETGGPLFGFESTDVLVITAADPISRARRSQSGFAPDARDMKERIAHHYSTSDGWHRYVGSWHSHPGGVALPSRTDLLNAQRVASDPDVDLPSPLFIIVSTRRMPIVDPIRSLRFWRWSAALKALEEATPTWWLPADEAEGL